MTPEFLFETMTLYMRNRNMSVEEARRELIRGMRLSDSSELDAVVDRIRAEGRRNQLLDVPKGVHAPLYEEALTEDARESAWYTGPNPGDRYWPALHARLESSPLAEVLSDIDAASTKVVAHFADPGIRRLKKKGLVVGYVQSGKTANYTAVMAKAADAGYRVFIVLSGLHNNLRKQTQVRINTDLGTDRWALLTTEESDFGTVINGNALLHEGVRCIAVVKKNAYRLRRLRDWLRDVDEEVRAKRPILIIDDEADQATPNSAAARDELSKINSLVRQIWAEVVTGSYVGYTATPFANVFMDPSDEEELYPSDFVLDLPRPDKYFGAEKIFGRSALDDADQPEPGLDMVREVPDVDAGILRPPTRKTERESFDPELPESLIDAVRWFILSAAVRWHRGQARKHSSMLVHTTQYIRPHFAMKLRLEDLLAAWSKGFSDRELSDFRDLYEAEIGRVPGLNNQPTPTWEEVKRLLPVLVARVRVVVDNGASDDRLDYGRVDEDGEPITETVIAVGGGTLSRGLTLEGLIVSYFVRTSNTYDTILQMGRWFGYRPGYEDLPRIWMPKDLRGDFEFLALVEEELREEMRRLEALRVTPREMGVRVRAHPGRLAITAANRMYHADVVQLSYAGQRHQTIVLYERERELLDANIEATRGFLELCRREGEQRTIDCARTHFLRVSADRIAGFISEFNFHPGQPGIRADHMKGWIERAVPNVMWNVAVLGNKTRHRDRDGNVIDLGVVDLGLEDPLPLVNRAPLAGIDDAANIKALLSQQDWVADFDPKIISASKIDGESYESLRRRVGDGRGLLIIYGVSHKSVPIRATQAESRRSMKAQVPIIGIGFVFPDVEGRAQDGANATYYSVRPDWTPVVDEDIDLPEDTEGSMRLDGDLVVRSQQ